MGLTPDRLRAISRHQIGILRAEFEKQGIDPALAQIEPMPEERRGGFLAIRTTRAVDVVAALRARQIFGDSRSSLLRLGPAPYLADQQLRDGSAALGELFRLLRSNAGD
jgi:kynureninase